MFSLTRNLTSRLLVPAYSSSTAIRNAPISTTAVLNEHDENDPMLQVGLYPKTKEERERAAKKYNLIPEDYEPYPEEEAVGDYPMLKAIGNFNRDRYDDFDDPYGYKFYGEVYHRDADMYEWERIDPLAHEKRDMPWWQKLAWFLGSAMFVPSVYYSFRHYRIHINHPWKVRFLDPFVPRNGEPELWAFPEK